MSEYTQVAHEEILRLRSELADVRRAADRMANLERSLKNLLAVIQDSDQRPIRSTMRTLSIVSGQPEFAAIDEARAALAETENT